MKPRIVITGMGVCSPIGRDPQSVLEMLRQGQSGIGPIRSFDATDFTTKQAAEIQNFDAYQYFAPNEVTEVDRATQMAVLAAEQAFANAGIDLAELPSDRIGLAVGMSGSGQFQNFRFTLSREYVVTSEAGFFVARGLPHFQTELLAQRFHIHGPHLTFSTASAGSGIAIGCALDLLRSNKVDVVLAGGGESFTILTAVGMESLGVSSSQPCSPFSGVPGITFGEGAAFFILEALERAQERRATIVAELLGYGTSIDGYDPISNDPSGAGLYRAMRSALQDACLEKEEVQWIKASGTGNREQDLAETLAIQRLFDGATVVPPVSSLEPNFGHANGAAPALGLLGAIVCQNADFVPPTLHFTGPRPGCDLDYVPNQARFGRIRYFLCNSMAFGGVNVALVGGRAGLECALSDHRLDEIGITGIGILSPIGCSIESFVEKLRQRQCGIETIDRFDTKECRSKRAGLFKDFEPRRLLPSVDLRRTEKLNQYATVAAGLALKHAGLDRSPLPEHRVGVVTALVRGPENPYARFFNSLCKSPRGPATGRLLLKMGRFCIASQVAQALNLKGFSATISDGITAGLYALIYGFEVLRRHDTQDAVVVVAADEIGSLFFRLIDCQDVLATAAGASGETLYPYDPGATGMILGEGAVALVLERLDSARSRQATVHAQIKAYGLTSDACAYGDLEPEGYWLQRAMESALHEAKLDVADLDIIYGHGRGLPAYDGRESKALARLLKGRHTPVGCVMGNTGVAEAASGLFSVAAAVLGMQHGEAYPIVSSRRLQGEVDFVQGELRPGRYQHALVAGSTENGNNAAVLLHRSES